MVHNDGTNLIFILGVPRSGTTLLSVLLNGHPHIHCPPEPWVCLLAETMGRVYPHHPANFRLLTNAFNDFASRDMQAEATRSYIATLYNCKLAAQGKTHFADKTPRYYLILDYLYALFPKAQYVWMCRNPFDVAASFKTTWGISLGSALNRLHRAAVPSQTCPCSPDFDKELFRAVDYVLGHLNIWAFANRHPEVIRLRYEALAARPAETCAALLTSLQLPGADLVGEFASSQADHARASTGDKKIRDTSKPHTGSIDAWRSHLSVADLQGIIDHLGTELIGALGYAEALEQVRALGAKPKHPDPAPVLAADVKELVNQEWLLAQPATSKSGFLSSVPGRLVRLLTAGSLGLVRKRFPVQV